MTATIVTRRELSEAYHDAPLRTTVENGHARSWHTGSEAVARLVAERAGIELVIVPTDTEVTVSPR